MKLAITSEKMGTTDAASMSLDDIIKKNRGQKKGQQQNNKKTGAGGKANNLRGTKAGGVSKKPQNNNNRTQGGQRQGNNKSPGFNKGGFKQPFQQGNFRQQNSNNFGGQRQSTGKLNITNLDFGVSDVDVRELFSEFGSIKTAAIHYGSNHVSLGAAHVHFANPSSAQQAFNRYNGVHLDGRPMRIALMDGVSSRPMQMQRGGGMRSRGQLRNVGQRTGNQNPVNNNRNQQNNNRNQQNNKNQTQKKQVRGGNKTTRGTRGGANNKKTKEAPPTVEQLNEQLDAYLNQASK